MKDKKIRVGLILGAHGVRGLVKLESLTAEPDAFWDYRPLTDESGSRVFDVTLRGAGGGCFIASIEGVTDRNQAEALKGASLYADRSVLPEAQEGEYYHADLVGLNALDEAGAIIGLVEAVHDYGAGAFLEIKPPQAKSFMLPFKDAFVPVVDIEGGTLQVVVPEGWRVEAKNRKK